MVVHYEKERLDSIGLAWHGIGVRRALEVVERHGRSRSYPCALLALVLVVWEFQRSTLAPI